MTELDLTASTVKYEIQQGTDPNRTFVTIVINEVPASVRFSALCEGDLVVLPGHDGLYRVVSVRMTPGTPHVICNPVDTVH